MRDWLIAANEKENQHTDAANSPMLLVPTTFARLMLQHGQYPDVLEQRQQEPARWPVPQPFPYATPEQLQQAMPNFQQNTEAG